MASSGWPYPFWVAHRGAGKLAPENTLAAFRLGARHSQRAFECDVKVSADGVPFLLHDATLERTTNGSGVAGGKAWSELSQLDAGGWHSPSYAGEPPASLAAIAAFCRGNGFALNIEIKPTPGLEHDTGRVVAREVLRLWQHDALQPLLSSFSVDALLGASETSPALWRALLLDRLEGDWLGRAERLACRAIVAQHALLDGPAIAAIHAAGLRAMAYTVNDAAEAERLRRAGIDGLITDAVDHFPPAG